MRLAGLGKRYARKPIDSPFDVDRRSGDQVLQPGFGQPPKPAAAHSQGHRALRHHPFDTRPDFVTLLESPCPGFLDKEIRGYAGKNADSFLTIVH